MRELTSSTPPALGTPEAGEQPSGPTMHATPAAQKARRKTQREAWYQQPLRDLLVRATPPAVVVAVLLLIWEVAVRATGVAPEILPAPSRVIEQGWIARGDLWDNTLPTLYVTLIGFAVSLVIGWALAIAIDFAMWLRRGLMPLLVASQTIPIIAIAPLVIIWFGFGLMPKVLVIALVTFFPVTVGLIEGFDSADRESANLVRSMGGNRWKLFCHVRLPSALPAFFTALRISITYAVTGAIFAEYVGAEFGLGIYMGMQKNAFRTDLVLAAVIVTAVLSVALFSLTYAVEYLVVPWHIKARRRGQ
ncbi:ABC transporter permease [Paraburkholderia strydomiana]|uniref:ABC transporter permease n=1 Tax=Paraburkholderia strydomiana TaxID=1245417 RepID=UPI0038B87853